MKKGEDILKKINRNDGMTVPEGFFEDFVAKMEAMLPERPEAEQPRRIEHRTTWQRVRPYVYGCNVCRHLVHAQDVHHDGPRQHRSVNRQEPYPH